MDVEPMDARGDNVLELEGSVTARCILAPIEKGVCIVDYLVDVGLKGCSGLVGAGTDLCLDVVETERLGNGLCVPFVLEKPGKELAQPLDGPDVLQDLPEVVTELTMGVLLGRLHLLQLCPLLFPHRVLLLHFPLLHNHFHRERGRGGRKRWWGEGGGCLGFGEFLGELRSWNDVKDVLFDGRGDDTVEVLASGRHKVDGGTGVKQLCHSLVGDLGSTGGCHEDDGGCVRDVGVEGEKGLENLRGHGLDPDVDVWDEEDGRERAGEFVKDVREGKVLAEGVEGEIVDLDAIQLGQEGGQCASRVVLARANDEERRFEHALGLEGPVGGWAERKPSLEQRLWELGEERRPGKVDVGPEVKGIGGLVDECASKGRGSPCRGRGDDGKSRLEVFHDDRDRARGEHVVLVARRLVEGGVGPTEGCERGFDAECAEIRAAKPWSDACEVGEDAVGDGGVELFGVDGEDGLAALCVREGKVELAIKPAWAAEGRVDGVGAVGCADDDDAAAGGGAVHHGEQSGDERVVDLVLAGGADGSEAVELVEKDNGRGSGGSGIKKSAELALGFAHPLGETVCALAHEKRDGGSRGRGCVGNRLGHERLSRPRWAVEEEARGRVDAERGKDVGVEKGEDNGLAEGLDVVIQPPQRVEGNVGVDLDGLSAHSRS